MSGRPRTRRILNAISHLLAPRLCLCCGRPNTERVFFCESCAKDLPRVENACRLCGLPNPATGRVCPSCLLNPPRWQGLTAPLVYTGDNRRLIHGLKFNEQLYVAHGLIDLVSDAFPRAQVDILIPVPLHRDRLIERGFNQSLEIARQLSGVLNLPLDRHSLQRSRATASQSGLSLNKRRNNIRGAFSWQPRQEYRRVAIVDDVITSGSTASEITGLLLRSGIEQVQVWGLARALKEPV